MKTALAFVSTVLKTAAFIVYSVLAVIASVYATGYVLILIFQPENRDFIAVLSIIVGLGVFAGIVKASTDREMNK